MYDSPHRDRDSCVSFYNGGARYSEPFYEHRFDNDVFSCVVSDVRQKFLLRRRVCGKRRRAYRAVDTRFDNRYFLSSDDILFRDVLRQRYLRIYKLEKT